MWSEHCSYKIPAANYKFPRLAQTFWCRQAKENAGWSISVMDWAIAFKIESHNHPSAIEPFQAPHGVAELFVIFSRWVHAEFCLNSLRSGQLKKL